MNLLRQSAQALAAAALLCTPLAASAQTTTTTTQTSFGAPQPGVDVPYRYTSPQQSQQLLNPQQNQQPMQQQGSQLPANRLDMTGMRQNEGEDASATSFMMDSIVGISAAGGDAADIIIEGSDIYYGITPDHRDTLPHISPYQAAGERATEPNQLTWLGFQPLEDRTRVFVQTGRPAQYRVVESPDGMTLTLELRDTRIGLSNFQRFVDASHFGRPVSMIRTSRTSDGVTQVTIEMARSAEHEIVPDGSYVYIDFRE